MGTAMSSPVLTAADVRAALTGEPHALRKLIDATAPIVQARVARALLRSPTRRKQQRDVRQDVEDLTQEVFAGLFADDARALRTWDPTRGMSFANFIGLVTEHQVASIMRSGRRNPWTLEPVVDADLDAPQGGADEADSAVYSREVLSAIADRLRVELSPRGLLVFQLLLVEEQSVESVCAAAAMTADALYTFRGRLSKIVRRIAAEVTAENVLDPAPLRRTPDEGPDAR